MINLKVKRKIYDEYHFDFDAKGLNDLRLTEKTLNDLCHSFMDFDDDKAKRISEVITIVDTILLNNCFKREVVIDEDE